LIRLFAFASLALVAQPQFPQHSTGMPHVPLPPAMQNHVTNLSRSVAGRPMPVAPGTKPIYPRPIFVGGGGWYPQPVVTAPVMPPVMLVNQQNVAPPAPILVVNPDYKPEVAQPVLREYSAVSKPYADFEPSAQKIFLLTLKDGTLRQAVAFWAEGETLHFVQPDHKQEKVALGQLDRESTKRFNAERGIEIKLP
jgi:hypothetical protein